MKTKITKFFALLALVSLIGLALPGTALAASPREIIIGNSFTLESGETLNDDLVIIGGNATLEAGSTVNGSIMLLGGTLEVAGTVNGDIAATGGYLELEDSAVVNGSIDVTGAYLDQDPDAVVVGKVSENNQGPFQVALPERSSRFPHMVDVQVHPVLAALGVLARTVVWALLAMLLMMFFAPQAERIGRATLSQPLMTGGLGLLTIVVVPIVLVVLAITILFLPVSLVGGLILAAAWAFGMISLGLELGKRFAGIFHQEWHPAPAAGLGTFLLILTLDGTAAMIGCIGWPLRLMVGVLGLGATLLTGFGMSEYLPRPKAAAPVAPPPEQLPE